MTVWCRASALMLAIWLSFEGTAAAEWQFKPFLGVTFGGGTTLVIDTEHAVGKPNVSIGISTALLGEVFGIEADIAREPGFFQSGSSHLVQTSSMTTVTGNVIVAMPKRMTQDGLRPYVVGGVGLMRPRLEQFAGVLQFTRNLTAMDVGGGVTGFVNRARDIGVSWEVRHFRSIGGVDHGEGLSVGPEKISFWRANMALAIRY